MVATAGEGGYLWISPENTTELVPGSLVVIMAIANEGYQFANWDDGSTVNPRTVSVMQDTSFVAYFEPVTAVTPPVITTHPVSQSLVAGETLILSVNAEGQNLAYQ